jgi:hypothetical protein
MPKLTQEQLATIRQRAENATPGPWETGDGYEQSSRGNYVWSVENGVIVCAEQDGTDCVLDTNDATFIAHARTDIPALLEHIAELEAEIKRLHEYYYEKLGEASAREIELRREIDRLKDALTHIDELSDEFFNVDVIDDTPTFVLKEDLEKYSDIIHKIAAVAYKATNGMPIFIEKEDDQ